jgi:hypothetical protein
LFASTTRGCVDRAASGWTSPRSSSGQPPGAKSFPAPGRCPRRQRRRCRRRGAFVGVAPQTSPGCHRVAGRPAGDLEGSAGFRLPHRGQQLRLDLAGDPTGRSLDHGAEARPELTVALPAD